MKHKLGVIRDLFPLGQRVTRINTNKKAVKTCGYPNWDKIK